MSSVRGLLSSVVVRWRRRVFGRRGANRAAGPHPAGDVVIRLTGSDTMVNLDQAWAENYRKVKPEVSVQIAGGGSGVGIAGLIDGILDVAACSRQMEPAEIERATKSAGSAPQEFIVGLDALAVYVHDSNPLKEIAIDELAEVYGDEGKRTTRWSQLGIKQPVVLLRRDHPRQPSEQFRDLCLLPRGRVGRRPGAEARFDRSERLEGRGRAGVPHTVRDRLQRHGLRRPRRSRGRRGEEEGRDGVSADARDGARRHLSDLPAAVLLHSWHAARRQ